MTICEEDSDVVRWGLHLLDVCSLSNSGSVGSVTHYNWDLSQVNYVKQGYCQSAFSNLEDNGMIAQDFQEEPSRFSHAEAARSLRAQDEHQQESFLAQNWDDHLQSLYNSVYQSNQEDADKAGSVHLCPDPEESSPNTLPEQQSPAPNTLPEQQWPAPNTLPEQQSPAPNTLPEEQWLAPKTLPEQQWATPNTLPEEQWPAPNTLPEEQWPAPNTLLEEQWPVIDDESILDGEVGKRLNQMVPVPHVPKTNGEIPSLDEASSDHERLLHRLELFDLVELQISGDGNCQFRSLSDQIYRACEHHNFVRQQIVQQLKSYPELYEGYVPMAYDEYIKQMSNNGEWGDHVTLQAAADSYGLRIFVVTSFKDTCYIEILPREQKSNRMITLSFWSEVHYNSIYPKGEFPVFEHKKKKRWWWH